MRSIFLVVLAVGVAGCPKKEEPAPAPKPVVAVAPTAPPTPVAPVVPAPGDTAPVAKMPDAGWMADAGVSTETAVKLFEVSCSTTFAATFDDMGEDGVAPECWARDFDQNCSPDVFGCWDKLEACRDACAPKCDDCQTKYAAKCDECKKLCSGKDPTCMTSCAKVRQMGRQLCTAGLATCRIACEAASKSCEDKGEAQLKKDCPDCEAIKRCQGQQPNDCPAKFPKAAPKCFEQCYVE